MLVPVIERKPHKFIDNGFLEDYNIDMCRQEVALEMLKAQPRKGGLSSGQIKLTEAQIADFKIQRGEIKMLGERMTEVEKGLADVKSEVSSIKADVKVIRELIESKHKSFLEKIPLLKDVPNLAWILLIIVVCIIGSIAGANLDFLKNAFHIGG